MLASSSWQMRCHFDVVRRVLVDQDGVEVADAGGAVVEARRAIAELRLDAAARCEGEEASLEVEFGRDLYLLVRTDAAGIICVIPVSDPTGE